MEVPPPVRVEEYRLDIEVDVDAERWTGAMEFDPPLGVDAITLDAEDLSIGSVTQSGTPIPFQLDPVQHRLTISVRGGGAPVRVEFVGHVEPKRIVGFYRCRHGDGFVLTTQCEPVAARRVFPCVDRPDAKTRFALTVRAPAALDVVSNNPPAQVRPLGAVREWRFPATPPMATYLFYLGVGRFDRVEDTSERVPVRVLAPPGRGRSGEYAARIGAKILAAYERYYAIDYPLPKLDMIAVTEHAFGAMENWGAISYRDLRLLIEPSSSTTAETDVFETVCHEIAHQWFGNLVTMAWWSDIWLNESFATFLEAKITDQLAPEHDPFANLILRPWGMGAALAADSLSGTHPVRAEVATPDEIVQTTDEITYGKGASVLRMMDTYLGEAAFRSGVTDYLNRFRFRNARTTDLWDALGRSSEQDVTGLIGPWIDRPGYPVIRAEGEARGLRLTQRRFRVGPPVDEPPWPIPITLDVDGRRERLLFDTRERTVPIPPSATVHLNPGAVGYYRVHYDPELLDRLLRALPSRPATDRWIVLNDLAAFVTSGESDWATYERCVGLLGRTRERLIVDEIAGSVSYLALTLPRFAAGGELARSYLADITDLIGLDRRPDEPAATRVVREIVARARAEIDPSFARSIADRFDGWATLDPDLRIAVAIARARSDGEAAYRTIRRSLDPSLPEGDALRLEIALAWSGEPSLVHSTLELVELGEINRGHVYQIVRSAAANPVGRPLVGPWLERSLPELARTYRGSGLLSRLLEDTIPFIGLGREAETRAFFRDHPQPYADRAVVKGLERLDLLERFAARVGG